MPPCGADVGGHPLQRHDGDGAGVLGDLRLLGGDDVHDDAALELLGHAALDAVGAGAGDGVCCALPRDAAFGSTGDRARPIVRPLSGRARPAPCGAGRHAVQAVVDVEVPRQRPGGVQPQQPGQPAPAQRTGVPDGVVVEPPGQRRPGWSCRRGRSAARSGRPAGRRAGPAARGRAAFSASSRSPSRGRAGVGGERRRGTPARSAPTRRRVARGPAPRPARRGAAAGCPAPSRPGRPGPRSRRSRVSVQAVQATRRSDEDRRAEQQPGLGRHGASG